MTLWLAAIPALGIALLIFALPGAAVLAALRVRGFMLAALAPAVSVSVIAVSAAVAPVIHLSWGVPVLVLGTAIAAGLAWAARRFIPAMSLPDVLPPRGTWAGMGPVAAGLAVAFGLTTAALTLVAASPESFTQGYDTVFHLNATAFAVETANASSFHISSFILPTVKSAFYPGAWHGITSLLIIVTGISVPAATNIVWLVVAGLVWPLSCVLLSRVLFGSRPLLLMCAAILAAAFPAFPLLLLQYGSAYPNTLSNALVPVGISLVLLIVRPAVHSGLEPAKALAVVALFLPGAVMSQPNGVFSVLLVLTPLLLTLIWRWVRTGFKRSRRNGWLRSSTVLFAMLLVAASLYTVPQIRSLFNYTSPAFLPFPLALLRNFTHAPAPIWFPAIALTLLVLAGSYVAFRRSGLRWVPATLVLLALTYPLTAGTNFFLANMAMAPWWDNPERIAALMPLLAVPLSALGLSKVLDLLRRRFRTAFSGRLLGHNARRMGAVATLAVVLALSNPGLWQMTGQVGIMFNVPPKPDGLAQIDAEELRLIARLGQNIKPGEVIANNPYNGSALAMSLAGQTMLFPYSSQNDLTPEQHTLRFWLNRVGTDLEVCEAAKKLGVTHLLDFGTDYIPAFDNPRSRYPGITLAADSDAFTLLASEGHARLYKLAICGGVPIQ